MKSLLFSIGVALALVPAYCGNVIWVDSRAGSDGEGRGSEKEPGPVKLVLDMFETHDAVEFLVGTMVNDMHQEPSMPQDLDIRRTAIRRLANVLRRQYRKKVSVQLF